MSILPPAEVEFIETAAKYLESPSFMVRLADLVGIPLEGVLELAPPRVAQAVNLALRRSLDTAVLTLASRTGLSDEFPALGRRVWWTGYRHAAATALTGGTAGVFGTLGLCIELPVTTCLMLRSICAIARDYGEDAHSIETRLECLSLFGVGGPSEADDDMDASYLAVRASMNSLVKHASKFVAHTPSGEVAAAINNGTAPSLVKLLGKISQRFEMTVSQKLLAQAVPLVGAMGGATVNVLFAEHFNAIARYHFGLRYLGRLRGEGVVRAIYEEVAAEVRVGKPRPQVPLPDFGYRRTVGYLGEASKPR